MDNAPTQDQLNTQPEPIQSQPIVQPQIAPQPKQNNLLVFFLIIVIILLLGILGLFIYQKSLESSKALPLTEETITPTPIQNQTSEVKKPAYTLIGSSYTNSSGTYAVISITPGENPYERGTQEYNDFMDNNECLYSVAKLPNGTDISNAERLVDFIDCIGDPMKLLSVSPKGDIYILSESGDGGTILASMVKGRQKTIIQHNRISETKQTDIKWGENSITFPGVPTEFTYNPNKVDSQLTSITLPFEVL